MLDVFVRHVMLLDLALRPVVRLEIALDGKILDILESRVAGNRDRLFADQLHAVIVFRIMAGRDHDAAVQSQMERGEINHLGAALPDVHHVTARLRQAARQRLRDRRTGQPDIVPHCHALRAQKLDESLAHTISEFLVDLIGINAAHVVSAKAFSAEFHKIPSCTQILSIYI